MYFEKVTEVMSHLQIIYNKKRPPRDAIKLAEVDIILDNLLTVPYDIDGLWPELSRSKFYTWAEKHEITNIDYNIYTWSCYDVYRNCMHVGLWIDFNSNEDRVMFKLSFDI